MNTNDLRARVKQTVATQRLLEQAAIVVLMVSGGSDSVALARLMPTLYPANHFEVLHVNHQLRADAADADESFVQKLCAELDLPCTIERINVAALAKKRGESLEQAGRAARYERAEALLDELCLAKGMLPQQGRIATAHTMDDRAETYLMRVIVGGGSGSLASIPYQRGRIIRPLLDCRKQVLADWLRENFGASAWREDASNADTAQARAFVRHDLLPLLAGRNPTIVETLARSADVLTVESAYLTAAAEELLPLTSASFNAPLALLRRAIYLAADAAFKELAPGARITFEHIDLIAAKGAKPGFACHLPGGIEVRNSKGELRFFAAKPPQHDPRTNSEHTKTCN
ncbi:MAG: tRNA lysidine(34) synthetase TilS [Coriobacteriales bacterium]|nr:tRNA lysidine(34) synthetase TilS [Coriobacteriales bacterium]